MEKKTFNYLPNGSVVMVNGKKERVMISGRAVKETKTGEMFDYMGYRYPQGFQVPGDGIFFNHSQIEMVFFLGFQDMEELVYREVLWKLLEEIEVKEKGKE